MPEVAINNKKKIKLGRQLSEMLKRDPILEETANLFQEFQGFRNRSLALAFRMISNSKTKTKTDFNKLTLVLFLAKVNTRIIPKSVENSRNTFRRLKNTSFVLDKTKMGSWASVTIKII
jgi:hypothetical protein